MTSLLHSPTAALAAEVSGEAVLSPPPRRKGGRPTRRSAEEIGRRILAAAQKLFLSGGFMATSMDAVAEEASVSKATLYARHKDKEALFQAMAFGLIETRMKLTEDPKLLAPEIPLKIRLTILAEHIATTQLRPEVQALMRVMFLEHDRFPGLTALLRQEGTQRGLERIGAILAASPEMGARPPERIARDAEIFMHLFRLPPPQPMSAQEHAALAAQLVADTPYRVEFFLRGAEAI